ncbi:dienelactone hydrolase family protein [Robertmurraya korlensis]|uniref:dienelactone hydrolase family protein n=1 Tax=Robertmurraya korlensis TaxID=519977 RepID=UPI0008268536|nr:dienelactone hydrolase family protein [Robertmurraya korlensis]
MNKSDKLIIVIHEIYGVNQHIKTYCNHLDKLGYEVFFPNLLKNKQPFPYEQEEMAYQHFMKEIGFFKARDKILKTIKESRGKYKNIYLVGFSVGATIAWLCSEVEGIDGVVGYYGSRIRDYIEIEPACPALLLFSEKEEGFHIDNLILKLIDKKVEVHKFEGKHGFSDPYSLKYNQHSAEDAFRRVVDFLDSLEQRVRCYSGEK